MQIFNTRNTKFGLLRKEILDYYSAKSKDNISAEEAGLLRYLRKNIISVFPYPFQDRYQHENIRVFKDNRLGLRFVLQDGKRLCFKKSWDAALIQKKYNCLLQEQDIDSPHRYLLDDFDIKEGAVVADVGATEGSFFYR